MDVDSFILVYKGSVERVFNTATQTPVKHSAQIVENCFHSVVINQESKLFTG